MAEVGREILDVGNESRLSAGMITSCLSCSRYVTGAALERHENHGNSSWPTRVEIWLSATKWHL